MEGIVSQERLQRLKQRDYEREVRRLQREEEESLPLEAFYPGMKRQDLGKATEIPWEDEQARAYQKMEDELVEGFQNLGPLFYG